jgi:hypothetical protein
MVKNYFFLLRAVVCMAVAVMVSLPLFAQRVYDAPGQLRTEQLAYKQVESRQKMLNGLNTLMKVVGYLNYSDRSADRAVSGVEVFEPYRGKEIRNVDVRILEPYGVSIDNPFNNQLTKFQKFANKVQVGTREWVVRNDLQFKTGETVDPILFADTERNLWKRGTFKDLKIFLHTTDEDPGMVDVIVVVQDRWSWNIYANAGMDRINAGVQFKNFLGLPHSIQQGVMLNYRKDNLYTVYGGYSYNNINRSQVDMAVEYTYENFTKGVELNIERDFFSAKPQWAGHLFADFYKESATASTLTSNTVKTNTMYNSQDVWLARSMKLPGAVGRKFELLRFIVSARYERMHYIARPFTRSEDGAYSYFNHSNYFLSFGLANWDYYQDRNVYYLNRAEYFAKGFNIAFIGGFNDDEELGKRFYSSVRFDYGHYFNKVGYLYFDYTYGGYTKKDAYQQALSRLKTVYYSQLYKLGKTHVRHVITTITNMGFNRPLGKEIIVDNSNGVRGLFSNYKRGNTSFALGLETDFNADFKVLGFTSCLYFFADWAFIGKSELNLTNKVTQAYGLGLRLRNMDMGIDYIEISFAYYPGLNVPEQKPYNIIGDYKNDHALIKNNLFVPEVLEAE